MNLRYDVRCWSNECDDFTIACDVPGDEARAVYDGHGCPDGLKQMVRTDGPEVARGGEL